LILITIPSSVEMLDERCFFQCRLLSSVAFESGSRLSGSQEKVLTESEFRGVTRQGSAEET
jgi:hypothetical protein